MDTFHLIRNGRKVIIYQNASMQEPVVGKHDPGNLVNLFTKLLAPMMIGKSIYSGRVDDHYYYM